MRVPDGDWGFYSNQRLYLLEDCRHSLTQKRYHSVSMTSVLGGLSATDKSCSLIILSDSCLDLINQTCCAGNLMFNQYFSRWPKICTIQQQKECYVCIC